MIPNRVRGTSGPTTQSRRIGIFLIKPLAVIQGEGFSQAGSSPGRADGLNRSGGWIAASALRTCPCLPYLPILFHCACRPREPAPLFRAPGFVQRQASAGDAATAVFLTKPTNQRRGAMLALHLCLQKNGREACSPF